MSQFPLNVPTVGRSQYANKSPLAPSLTGPAPQDDEFAGIRQPYEPSAPGEGSGFATGQGESMGASNRVTHSQPQSRGQALISGIAPSPEQTTGSANGGGGYIMPPAVSRPEMTYGSVPQETDGLPSTLMGHSDYNS